MVSVGENQIAYERDALYYPHIYIRRRDINWLKATLLCFPHVHRIIPTGFAPDDSDQVSQFRKVKLSDGYPLLMEQDTRQPAVDTGQSKLLKKIQENEEIIRNKYSIKKAQEEYGKKYNSFKVHRGKMGPLLNYLKGKSKEESLAWPSYDKKKDPNQEWFSLHPVLGGAVMANIAIAIANDQGLNIVTSQSDVHHAVVSRNDEEVFNTLLDVNSEPVEVDIRETADDLAEIVMITAFDVSKLSAQQIANLIKDGNDLRKFKNALMPLAARIPPIRNNKVRTKRLENYAGEVIQEWKKYKKSLPRFALDAIYDATEIKFPEIASSILLGASGLTLGLGAGLGIGLLTYGGVRIWRRYRENSASPYQYLTRIEKAGASLVLPPIQHLKEDDDA